MYTHIETEVCMAPPEDYVSLSYILHSVYTVCREVTVETLFPPFTSAVELRFMYNGSLSTRHMAEQWPKPVIVWPNFGTQRVCCGDCPSQSCNDCTPIMQVTARLIIKYQLQKSTKICCTAYTLTRVALGLIHYSRRAISTCRTLTWTVLGASLQYTVQQSQSPRPMRSLDQYSNNEVPGP